MSKRKTAVRAEHITTKKIDPASVIRSIGDDSAGGIVLFLGTVRNRSEAGEVREILYEAYEEMAEKRLAGIEAQVRKTWPVKQVKILHRIGRLKLGEVSVAVGVAAEHRAEAFEACRQAMEWIKHDVPIWKKEKLAGDVEKWVAGVPMESSSGSTA